jgi:hypothetical protein
MLGHAVRDLSLYRRHNRDHPSSKEPARVLISTLYRFVSAGRRSRRDARLPLGAPVEFDTHFEGWATSRVENFERPQLLDPELFICFESRRHRASLPFRCGAPLDAPKLIRRRHTAAAVALVGAGVRGPSVVQQHAVVRTTAPCTRSIGFGSLVPLTGNVIDVGTVARHDACLGRAR